MGLFPFLLWTHLVGKWDFGVWFGGTLLLYYSITLYKSPEKKWHRSPKMDKNINVHFSKVPGKCCNGVFEKHVVSIMQQIVIFR